MPETLLSLASLNNAVHLTILLPAVAGKAEIVWLLHEKPLTKSSMGHPFPIRLPVPNGNFHKNLLIFDRTKIAQQELISASI